MYFLCSELVQLSFYLVFTVAALSMRLCCELQSFKCVMNALPNRRFGCRFGYCLLCRCCKLLLPYRIAVVGAFECYSFGELDRLRIDYLLLYSYRHIDFHV